MPAKASSDLFDLIKSLDAGEKRYFKLQAQLQKGSKNYLLLFNAIDKQSEYDEARIKRKFEGQAFARQISVAKNYLYNLILDALEAYHEDGPLEVRRLAHKAEILLNKGLWSQSRKVLGRAREQAQRAEYFLELLSVQAMEWRLAFDSARDYSDLGQKSEEFLEELNATINKMRNLNQYNYGVSKLPFIQTDMYRTSKREKIRAELTKLLDHPLLSGEQQALSFRARGFYHDTRGHIFLAIGLTEKAAEERRHQMELDGAHIEISGVENYLISIHNLGSVLVALGRFAELNELIDRINAVCENKSYIRQGRILARASYTRVFLAQYSILGNDQDDPELLISMEAQIKEYAAVNGTRRTSLSTMLFAMIHLRYERYDRALEIAMRFLNDTPPTILRDFHVLMRICAMLCLYESGAIVAVEHGIKALKRYTKHPELSTDYERNIFDALNKLLRIKTPAEEREVFKALHTTLAELLAQQKGYAAVLQPVFVTWIERHADKYS